jgi:hypothetical protein
MLSRRLRWQLRYPAVALARAPWSRRWRQFVRDTILNVRDMRDVIFERAVMLRGPTTPATCADS